MQTGNDIMINDNGYLLVFMSNRSPRSVHIDNLNVSYSKGRLLEEQHYYPHGLVVRNATATRPSLVNRYLYQGKELQDELGLQLYDFHARQYDTQIGRFWGIDPADQFPSGYTGMGNDPANGIDPDGRQVLGGGAFGGGPISGGSPARDMSGAWTWVFGIGDGSRIWEDMHSGYDTDLDNTGNGGGGGGDDGDDTDVYTKKGEYAGTVNDNLQNQVHFVDGNIADVKGLISYLNGLSDVDRDAIVGYLRGLSIAFIGESGSNELRAMALTAAGTGDFGTEIPFYATVGANRELRFTFFPSSSNGNASQAELETAGRNFARSGGNINSTFGTGHPHMENWHNGYLYSKGRSTLSDKANMGYYSKITPPSYDQSTRMLHLNDYINLYNRQVPLFISNLVGLTIYNTNQESKFQKDYYYFWFNRK